MKDRIPSLDGVRAVSIGLVITGHLLTWSSWPMVWRLHFGALGVRTFFVISGFIITTLLLDEFQESQQIKLKRFYIRRAARILPAYWLFIGTVALLIPAGLVQAKFSDLPAALGYFSDYDLTGLALAHTWSLSVEEQFYLLWPATLLLTRVVNAPYVCGALLLTAPAFRVLAHLRLWPTHQSFAFECVCDSLAAGCILAMLRPRLWAIPSYRAFVASPYVLFALVGLIALMAIRPESITSDLLMSPLNLLIAAALDRYMRLPNSAVGRLLNSTVLVWLGTISYGLYLWQQIFTLGHLPVLVKIVAPLACAAVSFYLIETPIRRWVRDWLREKPETVAAPLQAKVGVLDNPLQ